MVTRDKTDRTPRNETLVVKEALDEHEKLRRAQETKNEAVIALLRSALLAVIFLGNLSAQFVPWAPHASLPLMSLFGLYLLISLAFLFYIRSHPPYRPLRKYYVTAADMVLFLLTYVADIGTMSLPTIYFALLAVFSMLIVLSGLRYSTRAVLFAGGMALLLEFGFLGLFSPFFPARSLFSPEMQKSIRAATMADNLSAFFHAATILSTVTAGVAFSVNSLIAIHRKAMEREWLARFLAPELVEQVAKDPGLIYGHTERRVATVIFADIRGFTSLSERMEPGQVVEMLNLYLHEATQAVLEQQGMLDKYIGDAVMGVFGFPTSTGDDAIRAMRAALAMQKRFKDLNTRLAQAGLPAIAVGVGLHTGELVAGAIGPPYRPEYTVIGDTVNVASRLEGMTRHYPVEILLSDATKEALQNTFPLQEVATVQVKGRETPVTLWSPE